MKKIIPFEKDIKFNTKIYEINSISLEHTLKCEDNEISGDFIISGDYKESDVLIKTEPFIHNVPFNIMLDERFDEIKVDIEDFSYEIINEDILRVKIDVFVNIDLIEDISPDVILDKIDEENNINEERFIDDGIIEESIEKVDIHEENNNLLDDKVDKELIDSERSIFDSYSTFEESYVTYHVHIFRENDSLEEINKLYNLKGDELKDYNDLSKITVGSKIIIPNYEL